MSALKFSKARDTELAWIDGMINMQNSSKSDLKDNAEDEGESVR